VLLRPLSAKCWWINTFSRIPAELTHFIKYTYRIQVHLLVCKLINKMLKVELGEGG
jgi:hypothetical protein